MTVAHWDVAIFAFAMSIGDRASRPFGVTDMPAAWLGCIVPGFEMMRAPTRWALLNGIAAPVLAAIGTHEVNARISAVHVLAAAPAEAPFDVVAPSARP